jgi:hypothetical protein
MDNNRFQALKQAFADISPQFINWRAVQRPDGRTDKQPVSPYTGKLCNALDPANRATLEAAAATGMEVGFVVTDGCGLFFYDVDNCIKDGVRSSTAASMSQMFAGCYEEESQSGEGLHFIGRIPEQVDHSCDNKSLGTQFYTKSRFAALTGTKATGSANFTPPAAVYRGFNGQYFPPGATAAPDAEWTTGPCPEYNGPTDDAELIARMRDSKSARGILGAAASIRELLDADADALGRIFPDTAGDQGRAFDWSSADAALCSHLAFWTGKDCERMDRLVRQSGLFRDKWEREDYAQRTITRAVAQCQNVYKQRGPDADAPAPVIEQMNKSHAMMMVGGKARILTEFTDPKTGYPDFTLSTVADFETLYCNQMMLDPDKPPKKISIGKFWLSHADRRQYKGIGFYPGIKTPPGWYNLYNGHAIEPIHGDWGLYWEFILNVIADGKQTIAVWILAWMARIIQDPGGERPGTAIVLRGGQGTGKGTFVNILGRLFGKHYIQLSDMAQVTGRFNFHFSSILLAFFDEAIWAGNKQAEGTIKRLITEPTIVVEKKGIDSISIDNYLNLIIASNNDWVVPAGMEERRFFVLDISDIRQQDHNYFKPIHNQMNNGGLEALLYYLLNMDISTINLRVFEKTEALFQQKYLSMSSVQKFWYDRLEEGVIVPDNPRYPEDWPAIIYNDDLFNAYLSSTDSRRALNAKQFGRSFLKLCKNSGRTRPIDGGVRRYARIIPALEECRTEFEKLIGAKISWEENPC